MSGQPNETILETIERRLIPDEQAKKARGEVFTPLNLVRELLYGLRKTDVENGDMLPWGVDKENNIAADDDDDRVGGIPLELWRDPDSKWLDPANGIGNFPFVAFHMLDFQLKNHGTKGSKEWTDEKRRKHIVEKMLYMIEIDKGNVNTSFKIMDYLASGSKPNICCADTLKLKDADLQSHFGVSKFDVVMGNPPFNMSRTTKGQTGTLWDKFITNSLMYLTERGLLVFITPANWRRPASKLYNDMVINNQLIFLHIMGERETQKNFGVAARVDLYIIEKKPRYTTTYIVDENSVLNNVDTTRFPFLPNYAFDTIKKILVTEADGIHVLFSSSIYEHRRPNIRKDKSAEFKFPVLHSMTQNGLGFLYTNDKTKGHFGIPKVLLNVGRNQYPYNDHTGEYGMSQIIFGIPITSKEEGDQIVEAINSDAFKEIIKATKFGTFQTDYRMFKFFRPDFYKEFLNKPVGGVRVTKRKESRTSSRKTRRSVSR